MDAIGLTEMIASKDLFVQFRGFYSEIGESTTVAFTRAQKDILAVIEVGRSNVYRIHSYTESCRLREIHRAIFLFPFSHLSVPFTHRAPKLPRSTAVSAWNLGWYGLSCSERRRDFRRRALCTKALDEFRYSSFKEC
jgi:hypothetical protein